MKTSQTETKKVTKEKEVSSNVGNDFKCMKAVYSYFFPEVRNVVHKMTNIDDDLFFVTTKAERAQEIIDNLGLNFVVPATQNGNVDLDMIHVPIIENVVKVYNPLIRGLENFGGKYFVPGTSQAIFHLLADIKARGIDTIYTLDGEYEGYKEYGKSIGLSVKEFKDFTDAKDAKPGVWFISNPSAKNGMILDNSFIDYLGDRGHRMILDFAYVGSTRKHEFSANHPNVDATLISLSKPYGLFRFRMGFMFTKDPMDSMYANKWFKDIGRLLIAQRAVNEISPGSLHQKYSGLQKKIVADLNQEYDLGIQESDAVMIARIDENTAVNLDSEQLNLISQYKRGNDYRLCLTPYFEIEERRAEKEEMKKNLLARS